MIKMDPTSLSKHDRVGLVIVTDQPLFLTITVDKKGNTHIFGYDTLSPTQETEPILVFDTDGSFFCSDSNSEAP